MSASLCGASRSRRIFARSSPGCSQGPSEPNRHEHFFDGICTQNRFVTPNLNVRPSGLPYAVLYGIVAR